MRKECPKLTGYRDIRDWMEGASAADSAAFVPSAVEIAKTKDGEPVETPTTDVPDSASAASQCTDEWRGCDFQSLPTCSVMQDLSLISSNASPIASSPLICAGYLWLQVLVSADHGIKRASK